MSTSQRERYDQLWSRWRRLRWIFGVQLRYRCRRLQESLAELGIDVRGRRVLDVGFGTGHMLASFPSDCRLTGAELSKTAVDAATRCDLFDRYSSADFVLVDERPESLPTGPFDIAVSSHSLEHVDDDRATLEAISRRLVPGGVLALFVPIERPDYVDFHVRNYSMQSIVERVRHAGYRVLTSEGSLHIGGHVWKLLNIPTRRKWPVIGQLMDSFRQLVLCAFPYPAIRLMDHLLYRLGVAPMQALVIARKPVTHTLAQRSLLAGELDSTVPRAASLAMQNRQTLA